MKRDLRRLPAFTSRFRQGGRRAAAFGLGLLALVTMVWQQEATMAVFVDREYASSRFSASSLPDITPQLTPGYGKVDASWSAANGAWAVPQYRTDWAVNPSGAGAANFYTGPATNATLAKSAAGQTSRALLFTDVAAGATHACGIARGRVFCWGTSAPGGLGLGAVTSSSSPQLVGGVLAGKEAVEVSAGTDTTCVRTVDGLAYCWGEGSSGQLGNGASMDSSVPVAVNDLANVTSISVGSTHVCAVADKSAFCWGNGAYGSLGNGDKNNRSAPTYVSTAGLLSGRTIWDIAAGDTHSCAVADGLAFCWGLNANGQLGNTTNTDALTPAAVYTGAALLGRVVTQISAGAAHSCAVANSQAFCWGANTYGRLGDGTAYNRTSPVAVVDAVMTGKVTDISAGSTHSCAAAGNKAYCWGYGGSGALGDGTSSTLYSPVLTVGTNTGRTVTKVSAGTNFSCGTGDTPAACWGAGLLGQIGSGGATNVSIPTNVALAGPACAGASVLVGSGCSLLENTDYYVWLGYSIGNWQRPAKDPVKATTLVRPGVNPNVGSRTSTSITAQWSGAPEVVNSYPEYTLQRSPAPDGTNPVTVSVTGGTSFTDRGGVTPPASYNKVSAGYAHTCAIVAGALYCWGYNRYGQLGLNDTTDRAEPTYVSYFAGKTVTEVSSGQYHTCAVADGQAYCWGYNGYGQLGVGNTTTAYSPMLVANQGTSVVTKIAAGQRHSCAVTSDRNVWCWGYNAYGLLGVGNAANSAANYVPRAVVAGSMGTGVATDVSAGYQHTCAIANSRAYCWGRSNYGQIGTAGAYSYTPTAVATNYLGTRAVTVISAGVGHTCAVAGGAAYCWGLNAQGQMGNNSNTNTYLPQAVATQGMPGTATDISAGTNSSCGVTGGLTYCWGMGTAGQLGGGTLTNSLTPVKAPASGPLVAASAQATTAGYQHACSIIEGRVYCWGTGTNGRLGNRSPLRYGYPQATPLDPICGGGSDRGDGTCTLAPGRTYYYRVSYTIDGALPRTGSWVGLTTSN